MAQSWISRSIPALALSLCACEGGALNANTESGATDTDATATDTSATDTSATDTDVTDTDATGTDATETTGAGEALCGDGVREGDEVCDGADLGGHSCASEGFVDGGEMSCTDACTLDVSGCAACQDWFHQISEPSSEVGAAIAVDDAANVYVAGRAEGFFNDDWTAMRDAYVIKFAADGTRQWTRVFGTSEDDGATVIATDSTGATYVAGTTGGSFEGYEQAGTWEGSTDAFLTKLGADGEILWTYQYGSENGETPFGIVVDSEGSVYLAGSTGGALDGIVSAGTTDVFISKFTPDGDKLWTKLFGTPESDGSISLRGEGSAAIDAEDNIILVGTTAGALVGASLGNDDAFIAQLDTDGDIQWIHQLGTPEHDRGFDVSINSAGDIFLSGMTRASIDGNVAFGDRDAFVNQFAVDGTKEWTGQYGSEYDEYPYAISTTTDGGFWLAGSTLGSFSGAPNAGLLDVYVARYDADGVVLSSEQFGSSKVDNLYGAAVDSADNFYGVGTTSAGLFGNEFGGGSDVFVFRLCAD